MFFPKPFLQLIAALYGSPLNWQLRPRMLPTSVIVQICPTQPLQLSARLKHSTYVLNDKHKPYAGIIPIV